MLRKKEKTDESRGETPRRQTQRNSARRALFSKPRKLVQMLTWSWDKDWQSKMAKSRLPVSVTIAVKVPWIGIKTCKICMAQSETLSELVAHLKQTHRPRKIVFVCSKCAGTYNTMIQATNHFPKCGIQRKSRVTTGEHKCDLCSCSFSRKSGLTNHVKSKHSETFFAIRKMDGNGKCGRKSLWTTNEVAYLQSLIKSEGSGKASYLKAEQHLGGRFSLEQIRLKCKALRARDRRNLKSNAPPELPNLTDFECPLPTVKSPVMVKKTLEKCLHKQEEKDGFLSPTTSCPKAVNKYVKQLIKRIGMKSIGSCSVRKKWCPSLTKRRMYAKTQRMYTKDKAKTARWILDGNKNITCTVERSLVHETYRNIWEAPEEYKGLGQFGLLPAAEISPFCYPISPEETLGAPERPQVPTG